MNKNTISIKVGRDLIFLDINSIVFVKAENIYTSIYTTKSISILASQTLSEMEEKLIASNFFKPHRSYLINLNLIRKYLKSDGVLFLFDYELPVPVSRNKKQDLQNLILK
mgnify:CR=1 FL=1